MTIQISTLSNGLRVATDTMSESESVVMGMWVGVGTRHEDAAANGVAHLVEHMMFKGTKTRSSFDLSSVIEKNGGMMNAHTSREETAYYARVLPEDLETAADVISDMLMRSVFAPKELDKERQVIIQEIGRDRDTPEDHIFEVFHSVAFPDQSVGRSILGSAEVIAKMPRDTMLSYIKRHYHTGNMILIAAGKVDHADFVKLAKKYFAKLPQGQRTEMVKAQSKSGEKRLVQEIEQTHLILSFQAPGRMSKDIYATSLLGLILGGSSASRLFQKVREERGLVYTISSSLMLFQDTGLFGIYAGTDPKRVKELMPVVCKELKAVAKRINPDEFARAQAQIRADYLMGQESVMRRAETLGHHMIAYGKPVPIRDTLDKYNAVTIAQTQDMAAKLIRKKPVLVGLGPLDNLEAYDKIRSYLS